MRSWDGQVLTGTSGAELLVKLAKKADEQVLQSSEEATGRKFGRYHPWMSNARKRAEWWTLDDDFGFYPSPSYLTKLKVAFNKEGPLREIYPDNTSQEIDTDELSNANFKSKTHVYLSELKGNSASLDVRFTALLHQLIPLTKADHSPAREDGEGLSTQTYRGAIFLMLAQPSPHAGCEDLLNLVHELGHHAFNILLSCDTIIKGDISRPIFSVIRKTLRPGVLSFHALAAVAYMIEAMLCMPELFAKYSSPQWVNQRFSELSEDLRLGLATIRGLSLTPIGQELVFEFEELYQAARGKGLLL